MTEVSINKQVKLSEHFTLGELCKTGVKTADGNIPSHVHIENLKRVCEWLEELRRRYNQQYVCENEERSVSPPKLGGVLVWAGWSEEAPDIPSFRPPLAPPNSGGEINTDAPIIITSGYRSAELNKKVGGSPTSNHLTGCAVDIRVAGIEQAMRYAVILMDYADETKQDYDEIFIEKNRYGAIWLHFAVRPKDNRRKTMFLQK